MLKVVITGISGQDGIFLTNKLLESHNNIEIYGTSRNYNEKNVFWSEFTFNPCKWKQFSRRIRF